MRIRDCYTNEHALLLLQPMSHISVGGRLTTGFFQITQAVLLDVIIRNLDLGNVHCTTCFKSRKNPGKIWGNNGRSCHQASAGHYGSAIDAGVPYKDTDSTSFWYKGLHRGFWPDRRRHHPGTFAAT